ncbi:MAG: OpgC domain-containing protein [Alphaproteobacteria bacterium]|nr:OpgC domain-containing protein [Alphaproteobacteria bacterium]
MTGNNAAAGQGRDPRLDFFRGSAMFIIYIAHCRGNFLWDYIPARYGLSDAADMFVFLSGMAASIAFGGCFVRQGMFMGTARILHRCWQLFVGHIGLFFATAAIAVAASRWYGDTNYIEVLQIQRFFNDTEGALLDLFTLSYVPHYFDILPLYIVVLAMVPVAMLLARLHPLLVLAASIALYTVTVGFGLNFAANADGQQEWYFNPLAWQLIFFTGFALGRGWIKVPLDSKPLLYASIAMLVVGLLVSLPSLLNQVELLDDLSQWIVNHSDKTNLDLLQYFHFLASAYVAVVVLKGREQVLLNPWLRPFVKCGQQALAVFLSGMVLSDIGGMVFDHEGDGAVMQILVNGVSFALLIAVAYVVAWFKATPWKRRPAPALATAPAPVAAIRSESERAEIVRPEIVRPVRAAKAAS